MSNMFESEKGLKLFKISFFLKFFVIQFSFLFKCCIDPLNSNLSSLKACTKVVLGLELLENWTLFYFKNWWKIILPTLEEKIRSEKQKSSKLEIDDDMVESDLRDYLYTDKKTIH